MHATRNPRVAHNLRFPGQIFDGQAGLDYNMARDYDPAIGRYIESDPILQPTRDVVDGKWVFAVPLLIKWSRLLLPYAYVDDQPLVGSDPRGLIWPIDLIKCMYYSNKYLNEVGPCKNRCGTTSIAQINFMAAYKSSSIEDSIFSCACQNAGGQVCLKMFESCAKVGEGKPKFTE
jgi:RHS repeat-associated protein